jgi:hypothetical protein
VKKFKVQLSDCFVTTVLIYNFVCDLSSYLLLERRIASNAYYGDTVCFVVLAVV